jgi:acyl-CoA dehydrogenase
VAVFGEQVAVFKEMLVAATPSEAQTGDVDYLLALGEIFTLVVYAQLLLENAEVYGVADDLVDQIFDVLVRDCSRFAVGLHGKPSTTKSQAEYCLRMIRRPAVDEDRYRRVWEEHVYTLRDAYEMSP